MSGNGEMSDKQIQILEDIHAEMRGMREDVRGLTERVDRLTERVDRGFSEVNDRIDNVIKIVGAHHNELEERVSRIEDHLGLAR
jgi:hypothetical protein